MEPVDTPLNAGGPAVWARPIRLPAQPGPLEWTHVTPAGAWGQLLLVLAVVLVGHALWSLTVMSPESVEAAEFHRSLLLSKVGEGFTVILLAWLLARLNGLSLRNLGVTRERLVRQIGWGLQALAATYLTLVFSVVVVLACVLWLQILTGRDMIPDLTQRQRLVQMLPIRDLGLTMLLLIPVVIHEELAFRGLLMPLLRRTGGPWWQVVLAGSLLFGAMHHSYGWLAMLQIGLGVGLALSAAYVLTRSLLAVMIAHYLFNLIQMQLMRLLF